MDNPGTLTTQTKIKNGQSRDADNIAQTKINKAQKHNTTHKNYKDEQHEPHQTSGVNPGKHWREVNSSCLL
jgi:hypothetical protein